VVVMGHCQLGGNSYAIFVPTLNPEEPDYLMGVSGAAFRLHIHTPGWCPSAPDATCGLNHCVPAMKALGYKIEGIHSDSTFDVK
jgi:hypothetical protein